MFFRNRLLPFFIFFFFYGIFIWFARGNPLSGLGEDLRVCFSLFTGLSLGYLLPNTKKTLAASLAITFAAFLLMAVLILFMLPGADFMSSFTRTTHSSAFILLGIPVVFIAPSMIFSTLLLDRRLIVISWLSGGIFLIVSIVILQTRTLFLTIMLGILLAIITVFIVSFYFGKGPAKREISKTATRMIIGLFILIVSFLFYWKEGLSHFSSRMHDITLFERDGGIGPRLAEWPAVLGRMNLLDHVIGMGFNPVSSLIDFKGNSYNTIHIGVVNIWWRLGFLVFLVIIYLFIRLLTKWLGALKNLYFESMRGKVNNLTFAFIICAPGVITLFLFHVCLGGGAFRR